MTDHDKHHQRGTKQEIIDLTSDSDDRTPITGRTVRSIDIDLSNNPFDGDDDVALDDDDVSTMHQLGSMTCAVRENIYRILE